ncbi:hypothetical protein [Streptomyces canus]|uniref:hypothetical protein n=1 Tax=Streptomyces canus TaxID=58343 RepID=UPI003718A1EB
MRACRLSLFSLMHFLKAELLVALSTCSSEAVLPQLVRKLEILGIGPHHYAAAARVGHFQSRHGQVAVPVVECSHR